MLSVNPSADAELQARIFPQSVASGDPSSDGIVLWTRIDPAAQRGAFPNQVAWQISASASFDSPILQDVAAIDSARDNTVKLPIANPLLQPFTLYYYRFVYNGTASRTGRFKTLPLPTQNVPTLKLAYVFAKTTATDSIRPCNI